MAGLRCDRLSGPGREPMSSADVSEFLARHIMAADIPATPSLLRGPLAALQDTLSRHYRRLGALSRMLRFRVAASDSWMDRQAHRARPARVLGIELDGDVRAVLELYDLGDGHAEIGLSVEDAYQNRGLGRTLFRAGLRAAREMGVETADLFFSQSNRAIMKIVSEVGAEIRDQQGDRWASIRLL